MPRGGAPRRAPARQGGRRARRRIDAGPRGAPRPSAPAGPNGRAGRILGGVSDAAVRSLERAVAGGDAIARVPLATAYLRQGRAAAALGVLEDARDPDATAVHDAAWRRALGELTAGKPNLAAPDARVVGWFGTADEPGRYAAVGTGYATHRPVVLDVLKERTRPLPADHAPATTSRRALFCWHGRQLVRLAPAPPGQAEDWLTESTYAPRPSGFVLADPDGGRLLLRNQDTHVVATWPDLEILTLAGSEPAHALDWARSRVAYRDAAGLLRLQPMTRKAAPGILDLRRAIGGVPGAPRADGPRTLELLDDGRLLVGPPLLVVDLDTGELWAPKLPGPPGASRRVQGPARLSRDRQALLLLVDGKPVRATLVAGERPALALDPEPARAVWHPFADLLAAEGLERGLPELRAADGATIKLLPRDARPLGWSPDGRTLLVLRRHGESMAVLEAWRAPAEVPS